MKPSDSLRLSLEKATATFQQNVTLADTFLQARGLSQATVSAARLGVVQDPVPGFENVVGRLSIPYLTRAGVVDMKFRCLEHDDCKPHGCPKYLALPNSDGHLYNVEAFFADSDEVIAICEGEIDPLILHYEAGIPSVGCPGVQRWQPHFTRCFSDYQRILIPADGDDAGRDFAAKLSRELGPAALPIYLPRGEDVNSIYLSEGREGLLTRLGLA